MEQEGEQGNDKHPTQSTGKRWNVVFPREGPKKTRWVRIGTAFERDNGRIDVVIDAWPVGEFDGRIYLFTRDAGEKEPEPGETPPRHQAGERDARGGFKLPEGYVHKVHMLDPLSRYKGVCGAWAKKGNLTDTLSEVTCRRCRSDAPKPEEPPPVA